MSRARNCPGFTGVATGAVAGVAAAACFFPFAAGACFFAGFGGGALAASSSFAILFASTTMSFFTSFTPMEFFTIPLARSESDLEAAKPESVTTPSFTMAFTLLKVGEVASSCCTSSKTLPSSLLADVVCVLSTSAAGAACFFGQKIKAPSTSIPTTAAVAIKGILEPGFSSTSIASKVGALT